MPATKKRFRLPKLKYDDVARELKKFGYTLLSKKYTGTKQILRVRCDKGHVFGVCWNNFSRGTRCKRCYLDSLTEDQQNLRKLVLRERFYNVSEAARMLRVRNGELRRYIDRGLLPAPTHEVVGKVKKHYKLEDIQEIEAMIE